MSKPRSKFAHKPNQAQRDWASGGVEGYAYGKDRLPSDIDLNTQAWNPEIASAHMAASRAFASQLFGIQARYA